VETGEYMFGIVPVELYKPRCFKKKEYLEKVVHIVRDAFSIMNPGKKEKILVCRGYMFDSLRKWLTENSYDWESSVIQDPLQTLVENTFEDYAISLGLPDQYIRYTKYPFHFHRLLKWVYADYENRKDLCKQGWSSWQKYGNLETKVFYEKAASSRYCCLICGKDIKRGSLVRVVQYITTTLNKAYTHAHC